MKLNKILMVLAATAIVGCTSEDLNDFSAKQAPEDSRMIQLDQNFMLAGVGVDGDITRTHWYQDPETKALKNMFLPIYANAYNADPSLLLSKAADLESEKALLVGLCWLGQTPGAEVYTNYQFYHFGWLNNGETDAEVECNDLSNGALYSDIKMSAGAAGEEAKPADWGDAGLPDKAKKDTHDNLNYNSGVYKTDNKAIFGGDYIVYYPFNENFNEAGTIPALAVTEFSPAPTVLTDAALGNATFRYSSPVTIEGGDQAAGFGLHNLSTLVQLKVFAPDGDAAIGRKVNQIVLYSKNKELVKQANLAADKIVAGQKGEALYAGEPEGTQTVNAKFGVAVDLAKKADAAPGAFITVLPTTVSDLQVLVHSTKADGTEGKWATIDMADTEFKAGAAKVLNIEVANANWKADYIAVDETSLTQALTEARAVASAENPVTITVIGDITLKNNLSITDDKDAYITITEGAIIVPEKVTLTLKTNMESDVRVLGKGCCTTATNDGGRLEVTGGIINNVTMEPTGVKKTLTDEEYRKYNPLVTFSGAATVAEGAEFDVQGGNVDVKAAVQHKQGIFTIAEKAKVTVYGVPVGTLDFLGTTVHNYGTIEVMKKGNFNMKNANGTSVWTDGQKMTNHATGKFIHNVDAVVGTAVQFMNQETNSEYRCRVDKQEALNDAYTQWTACSVIEIVNADPAENITYKLEKARQHKIWGSLKDVDIEVNNTGKKTTFQDAEATVTIGNLTVLSELDVVYGAKSNLTVNGNMTVSFNATLTSSKTFTVNKDLAVDNGAVLTIAADKANAGGLDVKGNITVTDATFNASADDAILIKCTNFSLIKENAGATATFGNRKAGDTNKTMEVKGTISNGKGCTFTISPADGGNLLAWITCYKVEGEGTFAGDPTVIAPPTE